MYVLYNHKIIYINRSIIPDINSIINPIFESLSSLIVLKTDVIRMLVKSLINSY